MKAFLETKDLKLKEEKEWLVEIGADCVLSDAAFLGWYVQKTPSVDI